MAEDIQMAAELVGTSVCQSFHNHPEEKEVSYGLVKGLVKTLAYMRVELYLSEKRKNIKR